MAFKPIYGWSGNHPVLDYAGTTPVCMESPCPFFEGEFELNGSAPSGWSVSNSGLTTRVTATTNDAGLSLSGFIHLFYKGNANVTFDFTCASTLTKALACYLSVGLKSVATGSSLYFKNYSPELYTGSLAVPWYRYVAYVTFSTTYLNVRTGDYMQIAVTP